MYSVSLRIPVTQYLPLELQPLAKRSFVNISAWSKTFRHPGDRVVLTENCQDAEVIHTDRTNRAVSDFKFVLGN